MAQITLYDEAVNYPTIDAVSGGKLEFSKTDSVEVLLPSVAYAVVGHRATTADAWQIEIYPINTHMTGITFAGPPVVCNPDDLGWKSMADLVLKCHERPSGDLIWKPTATTGGAPFVIKDAETSKLRSPTLAELADVMQLHVSESGDMALHYKSDGSTQAVLNVRSVLVENVIGRVSAILADTSATTRTEYTFYALTEDQGATARMVHSIDLVKATGTESISVGNYAMGRRTIKIESGGTNGQPHKVHMRKLGNGAAFTIPTIVLDAMRRASKAGSVARLSVIESEEDESFTVTEDWYALAGSGAGDLDVMIMSSGDPGGVFEISLDQANSLNVLATAAFSGLAGLATVGMAQELQQLLANSVLSPLFQNVATALGSTTTAIITGYVSALVSAYTQGWITNAQLFNMQNHVAWIKGGASAILAAGAAGVAIGELPNLLNYLGVSSNVLSIALTAAGGAATGAGVALGMASVMAKSVKHVYWGA